MEKQQTPNDVSRLIRGSMRPFDREVLEAGSAGGPARTDARRGWRAQLDGEVVLNALSALLALGFLALALSNFRLAGNFISIDSLFLTVVSLLLAAVFLFSPVLTLYERGFFRRFAAAGEAAPVVDEGPIHFEGSTKLFLSVLGGLLGLTIVEVFLAYFKVPLHIMLTILIGLSVIKAALIMAYFMHLRFERLSLVLTLVPVLVVCICLLFVFFPDSFRSLNLRSTPTMMQEKPTAATEQ